MILAMMSFCKTDAKTKFQLLSFTFHPLEHIICHDLFHILVNYGQKVYGYIITDWLLKPSCKCFINITLYQKKIDGMPHEEGQLWTFNDVYHVDVSNTITPISTMYPLLTGFHVSDKSICILLDIFIGKQNTAVQCNEKKQEFITELLISKSNWAGCKHYVSGSFIAYPEKYLVIHWLSIVFWSKTTNKFDTGMRKNLSPIIDIQSTIHIQHMVGKDY